MTKFTLIMLSKLIAMTSPGNTALSRVPIPECDSRCQETPLCDNPTDWRCEPPKFSKHLYNSTNSKIHSFTRPESYEEGLARYAIIAKAIDQVSEASTYNLCTPNCPPSPWYGSKNDLAHMMLITINQESGQRADIHAGVGPLSRGDCSWVDNDGNETKPFAKNAYPLFDTCKSVGLGQRRLGKSKTLEGWSANDIVGLDLTHTKRILTITARTLSKSRNYCMHKGYSNNIIEATFTLYGTGYSCHLTKNPLFKRRTRLYNKFRYSDTKLHINDLILLDSPNVQSIIKYLEDSETQILWMPHENL